MAGNYLQLYYHFVWATKGRNELITPEIEGSLYDYISTLCRGMHVRILAMNGMPDHLHIACCVPPTLALSAFVKSIKAKSSYYVNRLDGFRHYMAWQPGYGVLTFSKQELETVVGYIRGQKEHHGANRLIASMDRCEEVSEDGGYRKSRANPRNEFRG